MPTPAVPAPWHACDALGANAVLQQLLARRRQALERYRVIFPLVPAELRERVEAGGLDAEHWVLLVHGASAAAKLRQLRPELETALAAAGLAQPPLALRVMAR